MNSFTAASRDFSSARLEARVRTMLLGTLGPATNIIAVETRPSSYRTSFPLHEVDVWLRDGTALNLMLKGLGRAVLDDAARSAKPEFLADPRREPETYRLILEPDGLGAPKYYGTYRDHEDGGHLLLERVQGLELYQLEMQEWLVAARWLATMHERFARRDDLSGLRFRAHLLCYDESYFRIWPERALAFTRARENDVGATRHAALEKIVGRYDRVVEQLVDLPPTIVHGEFFASNVLVEKTPPGLRVRPVDWEMAGVGPGILDLAALTAGRWNAEQRRVLALAYYDQSSDAQRIWGKPEDFLRALDCCRIHMAMQWLGWSERWEPPAEHANDWLGTLVEHAEAGNL